LQQPEAALCNRLDEWGVPAVTRPGGYYDVAFPIQGGGDSFGANRVLRALQTVWQMLIATLADVLHA
jgi:hypothetical protein